MNPAAPASEVQLALLKQKPAFLRAALFSVAIGLLMLMPPIYMLEVYDRVVNSRSYMTLAMLTLLVLMAYVVLEVLEWARLGVLRQAAEGFDVALGARVYDAVFEANLRGARGLGAIGLRDFGTVRDFVGSATVAGLLDIPMALLLIVVIFWIDPVLGWFGLVSAGIQGVITYFNKKSSGELLARANLLSNQASNFVGASLRNDEVVRAMGMTDGLRRRWLKTQKDLLRLQAQASDRAGVYTALSKYVQLMSGSLMLGIGVWLMLGGKFTQSAGMILMASILAGRALAPLVRVIMGWSEVVNVRESMKRLQELLAQISAVAPGLPLPVPQGYLRVEGVSARAPAVGGMGAPVVRNVTFGTPPGKMLAVVGPSASGKSSLAHLLVGAWPCLSGSVRLDGVDVYGWDKEELGPHVGYLPQDVALFDGTIAQNIARFGKVDRDKVVTAAKLAGVHNLILGLPDAYKTWIGEEGAVLSGGTRQRIALARAVYGTPRLVVLDEPNANLDEKGEEALMDALHLLRAAGATVVVVTHRSNLLTMADVMLLMVGGEAKAFGPPAEVAKAMQAQSRTQGQGQSEAIRAQGAAIAALFDARRPVAAAVGP